MRVGPWSRRPVAPLQAESRAPAGTREARLSHSHFCFHQEGLSWRGRKQPNIIFVVFFIKWCEGQILVWSTFFKKNQSINPSINLPPPSRGVPQQAVLPALSSPRPCAGPGCQRPLPPPSRVPRDRPCPAPPRAARAGMELPSLLPNPPAGSKPSFSNQWQEIINTLLKLDSEHLNETFTY